MEMDAITSQGKSTMELKFYKNLGYVIYYQQVSILALIGGGYGIYREDYSIS